MTRFRIGPPASRSHRAAILLTAVATTAAALAATAGVPAAQAAPVHEHVSAHQPIRHEAATTRKEQRAIHRFWTRARMAAAEPMSVEVDPARTGAAATEVTATSETDPAIAQEVPLDARFGRLFYQMGSSLRSCSATSTASPDGDVVTTAAHCLKTSGAGGAFATNVYFVPGYDGDGAVQSETEPKGKWTARQLYVSAGWDLEGSAKYAYDVAFLVVNKNAAGRTLAAEVGSFPIAFDTTLVKSFDVYGYPGGAPYDGSDLMHCAGSTRYEVTASGSRGIACSMTSGSSGGAWISGGALSSVTSFNLPDYPGFIFGPTLGPSAQTLFESAAATG